MAALRGVHDAHAGKGGAGGNGGGNVHHPDTGQLGNGHGKIHDLAAAGAHHLVAAQRSALVGEGTGVFVGAVALVEGDGVGHARCFQRGQQAVLDRRKGPMPGQQQDVFAKPRDLAAALFQNAHALAIAAGTEFDRSIQYSLFHLLYPLSCLPSEDSQPIMAVKRNYKKDGEKKQENRDETL